MDVCMYVCICVFFFVHTHIYLYIHIQAYIFTFLNYHETACDCVGWSIICNPYYLTGGKLILFRGIMFFGGVIYSQIVTTKYWLRRAVIGFL